MGQAYDPSKAMRAHLKKLEARERGKTSQPETESGGDLVERLEAEATDLRANAWNAGSPLLSEKMIELDTLLTEAAARISELVKEKRAAADVHDTILEMYDIMAEDKAAAEARISALLGEREWRPIESAPRDGRHFLVTCRQEPRSELFVGHWWIGLARYNLNQPRNGRPGGAPFLELESREPFRARPEQITHWQPLPAPPASVVSGEG